MQHLTKTMVKNRSKKTILIFIRWFAVICIASLLIQPCYGKDFTYILCGQTSERRRVFYVTLFKFFFIIVRIAA